ncbi:MAG: DUF6530 family protein [Rikenellaceae bacterium]|nr:DUF6530 family protein [Rikenellaceae bacterium]
MPVPDHLSHKPITVAEYPNHDGPYQNNTDVEYLTVGIAQYDTSRNPKEISAKVLRKVDGKWSRQSEELPIHRVFDLASMVLQSVVISNADSFPVTPFNVTVHDHPQINAIKDYYHDNRCFLLPKLYDLKEILDFFLEEERKY